MPGWGAKRLTSSSTTAAGGPNVHSNEDFPDLLGGGGSSAPKRTAPPSSNNTQNIEDVSQRTAVAGGKVVARKSTSSTAEHVEKASSTDTTATTTTTTDFTTTVKAKRSAENMNRKELDWEMMVAADTGDVERLKFLIETCDADPNHTHRQGSSSGYNKGSTPIMYAARSGHLAAVDYLLSKKADPHVVEDELWNCLHYSCFNGHSAITARFLELKVKTDLITMFEKATPLGFATHRRFARVAPLFPSSSSSSEVVVHPFTEAEAQEVLDRGKKKLAKGRKNKATSGKFLFRYELRDDAFEIVSLFLEKAATPRIVQFHAFDHVAQCNVMMRMFKSWEDRDSFVEMERDGGGSQSKRKTIIRSGSVSGMQHIVVWKAQEEEDLSPQIIQN